MAAKDLKDYKELQALRVLVVAKVLLDTKAIKVYKAKPVRKEHKAIKAYKER